MRRLVVLLLCSVLSLVTPAPSALAEPFPTSLELPAGFYPEGIAVGTGTDFYVGSLFGAGVYAGDLRTGEGSVVVPGVPGRLVAGLAFDARSRLLWRRTRRWRTHGLRVRPVVRCARADTRRADHGPGRLPQRLTVTRTAIYVTDSLASVLWVVPLSARGLPSGPATQPPLAGDFELVPVPEPPSPIPPINLNGIAATRDGR